VPTADLLGKKIKTVSGAEVSAPTVRSFFRALEVFGAEIGIVRSAISQVPGGISPDIAVAPFLVSPEDGRLSYVIEGLCLPGADYVEVVNALATSLLPLLGRIDAMLGESEPQEQSYEQEDVDAAVLLVFGCAERFHISPSEVMGWPLGMFLDCIQAFSRPPSRTQQGDVETLLGGMGFPTAKAMAPPGDPDTTPIIPDMG